MKLPRALLCQEREEYKIVSQWWHNPMKNYRTWLEAKVNGREEVN